MATLKDNESFQIDLIEVGNVLSQYKVELEELLKRKIMDKNSVASGDLLASIHTRLEVNGTSFEVWLDCLKYLKFLDQGTKPHWMPEEPIIKWIQDKNTGKLFVDKHADVTSPSDTNNSKSNGFLCTIAAKASHKFLLTMWIEGTDPNCTLGSGDDTDISLETNLSLDISLYALNSTPGSTQNGGGSEAGEAA